MSAANEILTALHGLIGGVGAQVLRNASLPASVPDGALLVMRDGQPGEPRQYMGGAHLIERYRHVVDVEIYSAAAAPEAEIYGIHEEIAALVRIDVTLGGRVESASVGACEVDAIPVEDGAPIVYGVVPITLSYTLEVAA